MAKKKSPPGAGVSKPAKLNMGKMTSKQSTPGPKPPMKGSKRGC